MNFPHTTLVRPPRPPEIPLLGDVESLDPLGLPRFGVPIVDEGYGAGDSQHEVVLCEDAHRGPEIRLEFEPKEAGIEADRSLHARCISL